MKGYQKMMATNPEVAKLVMEKYPRSKMERRGCETERAFRDMMRWEYAKKIIEGNQREKVEYK